MELKTLLSIMLKKNDRENKRLDATEESISELEVRRKCYNAWLHSKSQ